MDIWAAQLFAGLSVASVLLLIALGLTFTFGQMNVVNMAHGEFIMAGAYTAYVVQRVLGPQFLAVSILISLVIAFLVSGLLGEGDLYVALHSFPSHFSPTPLKNV
jgi:urea transport system permease protein